MQTTINVKKKKERRAGNLSVEFLCSTLDLRCAVKNVEGSSRYPQESVASTSPFPARERVAKTSPFWYIKL